MLLTYFHVNDTIRIERGATDRRLDPSIMITKSNHTFGWGGYFFVFLITSNNNVTTILRIISTIESISKSLIYIPPFRQISYVNKISADTEGKFPLKEGLTAYRYGSTLYVSIADEC